MKSRPRLSLEEDSGIDNSSKNSRGPTGPQGLMGGDDDRLNKLLQEKLEMKRRLKQREYERLAKKSYILNKPETRDEISKRSPEYSVIL